MADDTEEKEEPKKGKGPLIIIIAVVGVVLVGGGAAAFMFLGGSSSEPQEEEAEEDDGLGPPGPMFDFEPFVVNLSDADGSHYLKVSVSVELQSEAANERFLPRKTMGRHILVMRLSALTLAETRDIDARDQLREHLREELNEAIGSRTVKAIYFTDFVTQ